MTMSREEDGQIFEEPGLIVYDIRQRYVGEVREMSPRVEKKIRAQFKNTKSVYEALKEYLPDAASIPMRSIILRVRYRRNGRGG